MPAFRQTRCGAIQGNIKEGYEEYLGIRYATAGRFEYPVPVTSWQGVYDATRFGDACQQTRAWFEHLEIPERMFYHKEYRDGITFHYSEDCLNLNIYTPSGSGLHPVILFIHGGGFNSGCSWESCYDGKAFARQGIVLVTIQYRVGVLGYLTHEDICRQYGHDGNFGLADQLEAIRWVKANIADYGGDPENITLMGQSAGAISIQYLCLCEQCRGLFQRVIMMSGGGLFPHFSLPRPAEKTRSYWLELMQLAGVESLTQFKNLSPEKIFEAVEEIKKKRKDSVFNTMPVIDHYLLTDSINRLIRSPLPVDTMIGYTNNDMYAFLMGIIAHRYTKQVKAWLYCFDIDAPGTDNNGAFHSSDLRYVFGTLERSFRPYSAHDYEVSAQMTQYFANFARTGNPNSAGLPQWVRNGKKALRISDHLYMSALPFRKLFINTLTKGDPK